MSITLPVEAQVTAPGATNDDAAMTLLKSAFSNPQGAVFNKDGSVSVQPLNVQPTNEATIPTEQVSETIAKAAGAGKVPDPSAIIAMLQSYRNSLEAVGNNDGADMVTTSIRGLQAAANDQTLDENGGDGDEDDEAVADALEDDDEGGDLEDEDEATDDENEDEEMPEQAASASPMPAKKNLATPINKAGRAVSSHNAVHGQAAHDAGAAIVAAGGGDACKAYMGKAATTQKAIGTMPANDAETTKLLKSLTSAVAKLQTNVETLQAELNARQGKRPASGGPIRNARAVEKTFSGQAQSATNGEVAEADPVLILQKALAVVPDGEAKAVLNEQLGLETLRQALTKGFLMRQ
jgi:hypothetical protein